MFLRTHSYRKGTQVSQPVGDCPPHCSGAAGMSEAATRDPLNCAAGRVPCERTRRPDTAQRRDVESVGAVRALGGSKSCSNSLHEPSTQACPTRGPGRRGRQPRRHSSCMARSVCELFCLAPFCFLSPSAAISVTVLTCGPSVPPSVAREAAGSDAAALTPHTAGVAGGRRSGLRPRDPTQ